MAVSCRSEQPAVPTAPDAIQASPSTGEPVGEADLPEPVAQAVAIAQEFQTNPQGVESVLQAHDLSMPEYEALLYEIALDPELSRLYTRALESRSP